MVIWVRYKERLELPKIITQIYNLNERIRGINLFTPETMPSEMINDADDKEIRLTLRELRS